MGTIKQPHVQWIPILSIHPTIEITSSCAYCQQVGHEFKNCRFVEDRLKWLIKKGFITSLQPIVLRTHATHVGLPMQQFWPQLGLVNNSILDNQHLGWQQPITPFIIRQPRVVPYPPYPMW